LVRQRVDELSQLAGLDPLPIVPPQIFSPICSVVTVSRCRTCSRTVTATSKVGVQISLPCGIALRKRSLGRSLVEGERIGTQREQLEQTIQVDVRNALQSMRSAEARLRAAVATREANEQQFASEQGNSTRGSRRRFSFWNGKRFD
jgi:hypothetical protein